MISGNLIELGFNISTNLITNISLPLLVKLVGMNIEYYFPKMEESIYGEEDIQFSYDKVPSIIRRDTVTGIYSKRFNHKERIDPYVLDLPKIYTEPDFSVPINTYTLIYFGSYKIPLRVISVSSHQGNNQIIYNVLNLEPFEIIL